MLLQKLQPIFAIILAAIFLKEKIQPRFIFWGGEENETSCGECGNDFIVKESVDRTWETKELKRGVEE